MSKLLAKVTVSFLVITGSVVVALMIGWAMFVYIVRAANGT